MTAAPARSAAQRRWVTPALERGSAQSGSLGERRRGGAQRHPRYRGRARPSRTRWHSGRRRGLHRRRHLLRAQRIPDHLPAPRRTRTDRPYRRARVLDPARSTAAARTSADGHGGGVRSRAVPAGRRGDPADRRRRGIPVDRQLGVHRPQGRLLQPGRQPVTAAAHLVAGGRGAVLPDLAAAAGRDRDTARRAGKASRRDGLARHGAHRRGRPGRSGCAGLGGRGRPDVIGCFVEPRLLRHRHPGPGAADRCRGGSAAGPGLVGGDGRLVADPLAAGRNGPRASSRWSGWRFWQRPYTVRRGAPRSSGTDCWSSSRWPPSR